VTVYTLNYARSCFQNFKVGVFFVLVFDLFLLLLFFFIVHISECRFIIIIIILLLLLLLLFFVHNNQRRTDLLKHKVVVYNILLYTHILPFTLYSLFLHFCNPIFNSSTYTHIKYTQHGNKENIHCVFIHITNVKSIRLISVKILKYPVILALSRGKCPAKVIHGAIGRLHWLQWTVKKK
jgi:hypothetical protein